MSIKIIIIIILSFHVSKYNSFHYMTMNIGNDLFFLFLFNDAKYDQNIVSIRKSVGFFLFVNVCSLFLSRLQSVGRSWWSLLLWPNKVSKYSIWFFFCWKLDIVKNRENDNNNHDDHHLIQVVFHYFFLFDCQEWNKKRLQINKWMNEIKKRTTQSMNQPQSMLIV